MTQFTIAATQKRGFWRCGTFFPVDGKTVNEGDFTPEQWGVLNNEPMLKVSKDAAVTETKSATGGGAGISEDRAAVLKDAIKGLLAEDYQKDGKPKLGAVNQLLADDAAKMTTAERDEVWAAMQAEGFEAPTAS